MGKAEILEEFARFNMIGASPAFLEIVKLIKKVAQYDAPVLIQGETGTGKELTARAIHYLGARRNYPFIPVNCGAVPDNLVENELFGHEKGAFTDAKEAQKGLVAQAHGGTLFLDEVETLSAKAQAALLRFLQDHEYRPLGSKCSRRAELRLIAATNSNLRTMVDRGEFRQDLFFRLNVISLRLPPLRERPDDIEVLARECIRQASARYKEPLKALHPDTLAWMRHYDWPGNIRELENFVHHAFLISEGATIDIIEHPDARNPQEPSVQPQAAPPFDRDFNQAKAEVIRDFEKRYLNWLMAETHGNITRAAKQAGKERREIGKLLKKHGIDRSRFF
jgi:DNA-binding NtrC family response regulator